MDLNPWKGFLLTTGNAQNKHYYYFTDEKGNITFKDTADHYYIILTFLHNSLNFSDTNTHHYFWDSKTYGTYEVTIGDNHYFGLDKNTVCEPGMHLKLIFRNGKLYELGENDIEYMEE